MPSTLVYTTAHTDVTHSVSYRDLCYLNSVEKRTVPLVLGRIKGIYERVLLGIGANKNLFRIDIRSGLWGTREKKY